MPTVALQGMAELLKGGGMEIELLPATKAGAAGLAATKGGATKLIIAKTGAAAATTSATAKVASVAVAKPIWVSGLGAGMATLSPFLFIAGGAIAGFALCKFAEKRGWFSGNKPDSDLEELDAASFAPDSHR